MTTLLGLRDLLRSVPADAHAEYRHDVFSSQHIPYGRLCYEAADEIDRLYKDNELLRAEVAKKASNET